MPGLHEHYSLPASCNGLINSFCVSLAKVVKQKVGKSPESDSIILAKYTRGILSTTSP